MFPCLMERSGASPRRRMLGDLPVLGGLHGAWCNAWCNAWWCLWLEVPRGERHRGEVRALLGEAEREVRAPGDRARELRE